MYDYLIVGAGLYGAVFAHEAKKAGKSVLVIDKRPNIAGNVYTEKVEGINVHKYGAHIFHTNNKKVWNYITQFAEFNRFTNSPVANYHGELYSLPFNMYTFNKMWGVVTPEEAAAKIEEQRKDAGITEPKNLEEQAISLVGTDIYEKLIKGYTEKQWGRPCTELPSFIIKRLPVRLTFDNNYFNALYQGIPVGGYTKMVANLLDGIEVRLNEDYLAKKAEYDVMADMLMDKYPDIDGIFAVDMVAIACIRQLLKRKKKVPRDVKVVAYDGTYVAKVGVMNLTVVQQPIEELAKRAVNILLNMIQGKKYHNKKVFYEPTLLLGDTTDDKE